MIRVCTTNPLERCCSGSLSATNARKGSMLMFMDASRIHKQPTATQSTGECGTKNNANELRTAPIRKKGRLRPKRGCQVLSLKYPIMGCTISPVSGAAIHNSGISSLAAPSVWKIRDMNPPCRANPN